jgi:capsular polysaccharide biosynthesis protein
VEKNKFGTLGIDVSTLSAVGYEKYVIFPSAMPTKPIFKDDSYTLSSESSFEEAISNLGLYVLKGSCICGRSFVRVSGRLLSEPDLMPQYVRDMIAAGRRDDIFPSATKRRVDVTGLALLITGEAHLVYGHWLLDYLPRLWMVKKYLRGLSPELTLLLPSDTPDFAKKLVSVFFPDISIFYWDWLSEDLYVENLLLPSMLHNSHIFHPVMNDFVSDMIEYATLKVKMPHDAFHSRLFVSRRKFEESTSYRRELKNEEDIALRLESRGFCRFYPEDFTWEEQVVAFSRARILVGEAGSAMHNAIFSPEGAATLSLRPVNSVQTNISALRGQKLLYLNPNDEMELHGSVIYGYDVDAIEAKLVDSE